jgi:hypothetical protein
MSNKRKAAWRFTAVWTFPGNMVATISTDPIVSQNEVRQMETEMKRLVLHAQRFPPHLRNIQLKYKLSDWELAQTKIPIQMPVQGYIQSEDSHSIDFHNLNQWFNANWSPVENQLRRDANYLAWVKDDPAYRHVQVHGAPAVAKAGRHKKNDEKQVVKAALPFSFLEFESVLPFTQIYPSLKSSHHPVLTYLWHRPPPSRQAAVPADRGSTAPSPPPGDLAVAAPAAAGGARAPPPASPLPPPPSGAGGCAGSCAAKRPPQVREAPTRAARSSRMPACTRARSRLHRHRRPSPRTPPPPRARSPPSSPSRSLPPSRMSSLPFPSLSRSSPLAPSRSPPPRPLRPPLSSGPGLCAYRDLNSLISPCNFYSNLDVTFFD